MVLRLLTLIGLAFLLVTPAVEARSPSTPIIHARSAANLAPKVRRLLARKPNAHIAVVQGSFDWTHQGHLDLIATVANTKAQRPDVVLVLPTHKPSNKVHLFGTFGRRLKHLGAAVAGDTRLDQRVSVSDLGRMLDRSAPGAQRDLPWNLVRELRRAFPRAHLSYALGANAFTASRGWKDFDQALRESKVDLVAVRRPGTHLDDAELKRASRVIGRAGKKAISSTEIRRVLDAGSLVGLKESVPLSTYQALRLEQRRLVQHAFGVRVPAGAPDITVAFNPAEVRALSPDQRELIAEQQRAINRSQRRYQKEISSVDPRGIDPTLGYTPNLKLLGQDKAGKIRQHRLFKRVETVKAKKEESATILANLMGLKTPLARAISFRERGAHYSWVPGAVLDWEPGLEQIGQAYDFRQASSRVVHDLVLSRFFNETIGNMDVWWAQFLRPRDAKQRYKRIVNVDFGEAWTRRDSQWVQGAIEKGWGRRVDAKDTRWTSRRFSFEQKLGWDNKTYDSQYTAFGQLWRAYVKGGVKLDIPSVKATLARIKAMPRALFAGALAGFLDEAEEVGRGYVHIQGAGRDWKRVVVEKKMLDRIYRGVDEFNVFLDQLQAAPNNPRSTIYQQASSYRATQF
ncbi:MAG: hypothetical protein JRH20_03490 [Deltaproteobacteria bacterium]|nr:hypothetical protein [Deltaproteobacteria bacterium]